MLCYVMLCYVMLCYVMFVMLCNYEHSARIILVVFPWPVMLCYGFCLLHTHFIDFKSCQLLDTAYCIA